ncbi:MAG TPA: T9SS type A sorting domain-containing protein, partial [Bacteroidia bacterium]|nr:T9SS type A sorting domain-containing protein [Bacteroidia bacterium]
AQIITTVAGSGSHPYNGDGGQATASSLFYPMAIAIDKAGNLYIDDTYDYRIRKVNTNGIIKTIAGNGTAGPPVGTGPATAAELSFSRGIVLDTLGNLYMTDIDIIRKVNSLGIISAVAGTGVTGYSGDGGQATNAKLYAPWGITIDAAGNLFFSEFGNFIIRKVNTNGIISTFAGNGTQGHSGDGGPAIAAKLSSVSGLAFDKTGNLYIADGAYIRKINTNGIISTIAGNGTYADGGDGGPATLAPLNGTGGLAFDKTGNLFITNSASVRKIDLNGIISTVAGTDTLGFNGDGHLATATKLSSPTSIAFDTSGYLYICDQQNHRIRKVTCSSISTRLSNTIDNNTLSASSINTSTWSSYIEKEIATINPTQTNNINTISNVNCFSAIQQITINNTQPNIYPNPANNKITIDATDVTDIKLFDVIGKQIASAKTTDVDVSNLPEGVYFIQVKTNNGTSTQKIIVQH